MSILNNASKNRKKKFPKQSNVMELSATQFSIYMYISI